MSDNYIAEIQVGEESTPIPIRDLLALYRDEILNIAHPVGSIYISTSLSTAAEVANILGGEWVRWGEGRVPVGVSSSDSDFSTVDTPVGSKTKAYTPAGAVGGTYLSAAQSGNQAQSVTTGGMSANSSHDHAIKYDTHIIQNGTGKNIQFNTLRGAGASGYTGTYDTVSKSIAHTHTVTIAAKNATQSHNHSFTGTAANINVVQPSITCYMYKRIA